MRTQSIIKSLALLATTFLSFSRASVVPRGTSDTIPSSVLLQCTVLQNNLAQLSLVFHDDTNLGGASYSPQGIIQGVCNNLPSNWVDRAQSVNITAGFGCTFFELASCEGAGTFLTGTVNSLPQPSLYDNIESFFCSTQPTTS